MSIDQQQQVLPGKLLLEVCSRVRERHIIQHIVRWRDHQQRHTRSSSTEAKGRAAERLQEARRKSKIEKIGSITMKSSSKNSKRATPLSIYEGDELGKRDSLSSSTGLDGFLGERRTRIKSLWRKAAKKAVLWSKAQAKAQADKRTSDVKVKVALNDADEHGKSSLFLPERIIDYFIVFGVLPPSNLTREDLEKLTVEEIEKKLTFSELEAGVSDRFPFEDHKDFPLDLSWANFAFPKKIELSWEKRPATFHFAVLTNSFGVHCNAVFLQFDEPLSPLLKGDSVYAEPINHRKATSPRNQKTVKKSPRVTLTGPRKELYMPRTLCIVSHYPLFPEFRKILSAIYSSACDLQNQHISPAEFYIKYVTEEIPIPVAGKAAVEIFIRKQPIRIRFHNLKDPTVSRIPCALLFDMLSIGTIISIFSAVLCEKQIVFHSHSLGSLTIASQCIIQLLYPFVWNSVYIPVVPESMTDALQIPQPYIQGIHTKYLECLKDVDGPIVVDLDEDSLYSLEVNANPKKIPLKLYNELKKKLEEAQEFRIAQRDIIGDKWDPESKFNFEFDMRVQEAFLVFFGRLFSGYRKYLFFIDGTPGMNLTNFLQFKNPLGNNSEFTAFLSEILESRHFDCFLSHQQENEGNPFVEYIATEMRHYLDEIKKLSLQFYNYSTEKVYKIPEPESLSEESETSKNLLINSSWGSPFSQPFRPELLSNIRKYAIKVETKKYESFKRGTMFGEGVDDPKQQFLKDYVKMLFSSQTVSNEEQDRTEKSLNHESVRTKLALILKDSGSKSLCLSFDAYQKLCSLLLKFLNICHEKKDYLNAYSFIGSAEKFYHEPQNTTTSTLRLSVLSKVVNFSKKKMFLVEEKSLRMHNIWQENALWETALSHHCKPSMPSSTTQSSRKPQVRPSLNSIFGGSPTQTTPAKESSEKNEEAVCWIIQNIPSMFQHGLKQKQVEKLINSLSEKFNAVSLDFPILIDNIAKSEHERL